MNLSELARQLKVSPEVLRTKLPELGFDIGMRAIKIDDAVSEKVKKEWAVYRSQQRRMANLQKQRGLTQEEKAIQGDRVIKLPSKITVNEFAEALGIPVQNAIAELMKNGIMTAMNEEIDYETAHIIAEDLGVKTEFTDKDYIKEVSLNKQKIDDLNKKSQGQEQSARPPVVVVMGHVDHGKTTLLDAIRKTSVVDGESGGITQHIGAYQVVYKNKKITFLDTPGHSAFSSMRSRGGRVADLAILVVAADDGIKQQTLESIKVIQEEGLDFIVAINKIDKPDADIDKVKGELANINLTPNDWGGNVACVQISAKKGQNIDALLEELCVLAEIKELKAVLGGNAYGTVIESNIDTGKGVLATVLVQSGILKIGDLVRIGKVGGKIKSMKNFEGINVGSAAPSMPVQILGIKGAPAVGDIMEVVDSKKDLKGLGKSYRLTISERSEEKRGSSRRKNDDGEEDVPNVDLNLIIRSDVLGSLEAIVDAVSKINHEKVDVHIIDKGLGNFTERDVYMAETSRAYLLGFHTDLSTTAKSALSHAESVVYNNFSVIYKLLDFVVEKVNELIPPEIIQKTVGKAKVLELFGKDKTGEIVGGIVTKGKVIKELKCYVFRSDKVVGEGKAVELQLHKRQVSEVNEGTEFGLKLKADISILADDVLEFFSEEKKKVEI